MAGPCRRRITMLAVSAATSTCAFFPVYFFSYSSLTGALAKKTYNIEVGHKARPYGGNAMSCSYAYFARAPLSADLYLGLVLSMFIVYLNESSIWVFLFWCLPTIFYANLMTLLYVVMHYDQLIARLLST